MSVIRISRPKRDWSVSLATVLPTALLVRLLRLHWNYAVVLDRHSAGKIGTEQVRVFNVDPGEGPHLHADAPVLRSYRHLSAQAHRGTYGSPPGHGTFVTTGGVRWLGWMGCRRQIASRKLAATLARRPDRRHPRHCGPASGGNRKVRRPVTFGTYPSVCLVPGLACQRTELSSRRGCELRGAFSPVRPRADGGDLSRAAWLPRAPGGGGCGDPGRGRCGTASRSPTA